jgi:SAM-dependent methyltransferase
MSPSDHIKTEYVNCDLCGSSDHGLLYSRLDPITGGEFNLVECRCGMAFVNPMPTPDCIPLLYPEDYLTGKERQHSAYQRMIRLLPRGSAGRLLDIGCGRGEFIHYASEVGWDTEGVDLMDWDSPYAVSIRVGNFLTMDLPMGTYDVVTAWALLEHVSKPSLFFEKISRLLKKGGRLVFVVPNISAVGMRHSCTEDIPRHLWLFSPRAVRSYLERYGMELASILHDGRIYRAYPFGLLRYGLSGRNRRVRRCALYENRSVALLRNRQIKGNLSQWISEIVTSLGPKDLVLDAVDLGLGIVLATMSKMVRNYGVITVVATKKV